MTLNQTQGHQTYHENVNPKQGYSHAKFDRFHFNSVQEKNNVKVWGFVFFEQGNMSIISLEPRQK